jgi:hypothetical protein
MWSLSWHYEGMKEDGLQKGLPAPDEAAVRELAYLGLVLVLLEVAWLDESPVLGTTRVGDTRWQTFF